MNVERYLRCLTTLCYLLFISGTIWRIALCVRWSTSTFCSCCLCMALSWTVDWAWRTETMATTRSWTDYMWFLLVGLGQIGSVSAKDKSTVWTSTENFRRVWHCLSWVLKGKCCVCQQSCRNVYAVLRPMWKSQDYKTVYKALKWCNHSNIACCLWDTAIWNHTVHSPQFIHSQDKTFYCKWWFPYKTQNPFWD
jgi:hypothetical protein